MQGSNPFGATAIEQPPLSASAFRRAVTEQFEGNDVREAIAHAVDEVWPVVSDRAEPEPTIKPRSQVNESKVAPTVESDGDYDWWPSYREHQRGAVIDTVANLYVADKDVVLLSAPTGAGKSLILYAAMAVVNEVAQRHSFFTTPLNSLIDQVDDDEFVADNVITIKGKNNYDCVHPHDRGTSVDKAVCQRVSDFECDIKNTKCPYYGRKNRALNHPYVVTNMSYLMANSMIPETVDSKFSPRELLLVDECQNIEDFALQFVGFTVSERTIPSMVFDLVSRPPRTEDVNELATWLSRDVLRHVKEQLVQFEAIPELTEEQTKDKERLQEFKRKAENFLNDVQDHHWVAETDIDGDGFTVKFNPIFIGRFLDRFLWSQANKVVLSSATIPKGGFLEEVGLDDRDVGEVAVESTFPTERRVTDTENTVGKMTMGERDATIPKMAQKISQLADKYEGKRGFVHCHSYKIAERIYRHLDADVRARTRVQNPDDREQSLDAWLNADVAEEGVRGGYTEYNDDGRNRGGQVFLSVAMDEGISLDDWRARWQVVAKAAYPFMGDKRVDYRLNDLNDWTWYSGKAAINLQQAVGRGMRSKDDYCLTYVLDTSAADLIDRNEYLFEDWFLDAVDETWCGEDIEAL